jgi:adenosylcobinamide kinase/adenosylcobinamide-phosphate guanylyltransferase
MGRLTLILGGARSGKSTFALQLALERGQNVVYIATAQPLDPEMQSRIETHKINRPVHWQTLEIPRRLVASLMPFPEQADIILLDCLTMLVSNILLEGSGSGEKPDEGRVTRSVDDEICSLLTAIQKKPADWIIVSNEVGMGLVPPYPLGRLYRDQLGKANQQVAAAAQEIYLMVAGMAVPVHQIARQIHDNRWGTQTESMP